MLILLRERMLPARLNQNRFSGSLTMCHFLILPTFLTLFFLSVFVFICMGWVLMLCSLNTSKVLVFFTFHSLVSRVRVSYGCLHSFSSPSLSPSFSVSFDWDCSHIFSTGMKLNWCYSEFIASWVDEFFFSLWSCFI